MILFALKMDCRRFLSRWRRWIRPLVMGLYVLTILVALPILIVEFHVHGVEKQLQSWFIGGIFVLLAIPIAVWSILQHVIHYTQPHLQRHIIRILWMVPIYAVNAWFGLRFRQVTIYLDTAREFYEAYVIYNFMCFLLNFLNREYIDLEATLEAKPQVKHMFPICWLPPWQMGRPLINNCRHGILQYTVVRLLTTVIAFICQMVGDDVYGEGDFNFESAWSYLIIINNFSQILAMYCLVLFYMATKEELVPINPFNKFLCIKAIVFFSFWQEVLIALLVKTGVIKEKQTWDFYTIKDVSAGLQDFCICIEMFLAAIAHKYAFSHEPYIDNAAPNRNCFDSFLSMWDVSDVRDDVVEHVRVVGKTATQVVTRPLRPRFSGYQPVSGENERTPLLTSDNSGSGDDATFGPINPNSLQNSSNLTSPNSWTQQESVEQSNYYDASVNSKESFRPRDMSASMNNYMQSEDESDVTEVKKKLDSHDELPRV